MSTDPNTPHVTLYGIKTCSTVRKAKKALEDGGYTVNYRDVRAKDMGLDDWHSIEEAAGWEILLNRKSQAWRGIDEADKTGLNREKALDLMINKPTLMKRPVIDHGGTTYVGWTDEVRNALSV